MALVFIPTAGASIIVTNTGDTFGADYLWTYSLDLTNDQEINTNLNSAFSVLYDIPGLVLGTVTTTVANVVLSTPLVGPTPQNTAPADSPSLYNIVITWNAGVTVGPGPVSLGTVSFHDIYGAQNVYGQFGSQATKVSGLLPTGNVGYDTIPQTPEPATNLMIGAGLAGLALLRRRRNKQQQL